MQFRLTEGVCGYGLDYLMPLVKNKESILDYFKAPVVIIDECKMVYDEGKNIDKELNERIKELSKSGAILSKNDNFIKFDVLCQ